MQAVNLFITIGGPLIGPVTRAGLPPGQRAAAPGDSGGPVYRYACATQVVGRGTITAGITGTAVCPGVAPNGSNIVFYPPVTDSLRFYGATLL